MAVTHQRQQVAQAMARRVIDPAALLTADELENLTSRQRTVYLGKLDEAQHWAQAQIVAKSRGAAVWAVILEWTAAREAAS